MSDNERLADLERTLAYNAAKDDIELFCPMTRSGDGLIWRNPYPDDPDERGMVDRAIEYLDARGFLIRRGGYVRILPDAKEG